MKIIIKWTCDNLSEMAESTANGDSEIALLVRRTTHWLLEPQRPEFESPRPAGSLTQVGRQLAENAPDLPASGSDELRKCNEAILQLTMEKVLLTKQLEAKTTLPQKRGISNKETQTEFESDSESTDSEWRETAQNVRRGLFQEKFYALARLADQEAAINEYRLCLAIQGYERGRLEGMVGNLAYKTRALLEHLSTSQAIRVFETGCAAQEEALLLVQLEEQAQMAELEIEELKRDIVRKKALLGNADARIKELLLVLDHLHSEVTHLRRENETLRSKIGCCKV